MANQPFTHHRAAALALLKRNDPPLSWKAGGFLGQLAVADVALSERQAAWLGKLLDRAGLPPLAGGTENGSFGL